MNTITEDILKPFPPTQRIFKDPQPVESPAVRAALVGAYKALLVLCDPEHGSATTGIGDIDPQSIKQGQEAIMRIESSMSPNLLCTVLETYTKVRFQTDTGLRPVEGQIREGAWGLNPERGQQALERRITCDVGFEFFVTPDTVFTSFEVLERGRTH